MTDYASTARRRELGAELRCFRERRGITCTEMAAKLHWHVSTLSRAETGKRPMTPIEVATYVGLCGIAGEQLDELLDLAAESDDYRIKPHLGRIPDELRSLIFHESTASMIDVFEPLFIPGMLQTPEYAQALLEEGGAADPALIPTWVDIRIARRQALTRPNPAQCTFLIHENALHLPVGTPKVMRDQLLHLLFSDGRPQCAIRVIPIAAGPLGIVSGSFSIFGYPENSPLVYLEHQTTSEFLETPRELAAYRALAKRLASVALSEAESRARVAWMASGYEKQGVGRHEQDRPELA